MARFIPPSVAPTFRAVGGRTAWKMVTSMFKASTRVNTCFRINTLVATCSHAVLKPAATYLQFPHSTPALLLARIKRLVVDALPVGLVDPVAHGTCAARLTRPDGAMENVSTTAPAGPPTTAFARTGWPSSWRESGDPKALRRIRSRRIANGMSSTTSRWTHHEDSLPPRHGLPPHLHRQHRFRDAVLQLGPGRRRRR
jgi:hypothetical protein